MPNYIEKSLDSFIKNASEDIKIYIAENRSDRSPEVQRILRNYVDEGKVKSCLFFEENTIGWAFPELLHLYPPEDDLFIMTETDLIVPDGCDYIKIIREAHKNGAVLTGCTLDLSNYTNTPNHGYNGDQDGFGMWLMGINTQLYKSSPYWNNPPVDFWVRGYFEKLGRVEKLLDIRLYHEAWDLWKDPPEGDPAYFKWKKDNPGWCYTGKPANMKYEIYE